MSVLVVTKNNYDLILNSSNTVLLDLYADWCGPCRSISIFIEQIAEENPQYLVGKINVDDEPELAEKFQVSGIPMLVVMKNGKIINKSIGVKTKQEILDMMVD